MRPPPPDFVIVGAPKCGTTSVATSLERHEGVFFSCIKEPSHFAFDYPNSREVEDPADYDRLFHKAAPRELRGEASTSYLSSQVAVPAILRRRPDAKFIVLVRNPVDMFVSWHNELLKSLDEDQLSAERAWRLQEARFAGRCIPKYCKQPQFLQYRSMCSLGTQVRRLWDVTPETQRLILVLDDLQGRPHDVYLEIVHFLGLTRNEPATAFPRENGYARFAGGFAPKLSRWVMMSPARRKVRARLKPALTRHGIRPLSWITRRALKEVPKPALSRSFRTELIRLFRPEVQCLEGLLKRDLSHWMKTD
jgi:Sulfotransferase domain